MSDENPIYSVVQLRHFVAQPSNDDDPGWAAAWFDLGRHLGYLRRYS